ILLLLIVLSCFTLFSYKAPKGMEAMGALASAAIATFLVEAFQRNVGGDLLHFEFLGQVGDAAGSMGGVIAAALVALAMGVSRSEEHTSELQSRFDLVCRLLLETKQH